MSETKTIWKFPFEVKDSFTLELPKDAKVLSVQMQGDTPYLWAMVNPTGETETRTFRIFGTGHPISVLLELSFIATFQMRGGALIFHVFEVVEWPEPVAS